MSSPILFKWNGKELQIEADQNQTVADVKSMLEAETNVNPKRQKLLGLKTKDGKQATDESMVSDLLLKPGTRVMLMGSPEDVIKKIMNEAAASTSVVDDFDINDDGGGETLPIKDQPDVLEKLRRRISNVDVKVLNEPRKGKKCLVLDIDYTLFDLGSPAERPDELARPYLHEFLTASYEHYDIVIWSATSMKWVEVKMRELGVLNHPNYKVTCMLDHAAMVTVSMERYGVFDCKPLAFLWAKFPEHYDEHNTIMFDDLRRNFVMNPQCGLKIRPFRHAHQNRESDRELQHLTQYLLKIAAFEKISHLDHRKWEEFLFKRAHK